ncbi:hypothetical protein HAX54_026641 [Datura stramonium]|uniref:Uncharacterized protein n=1 Tax=Datura stramonium TaxID=4076 RepID=A0ABS8V3I6_DATST|nr:hypothetical protein [Datura stramonium]
MHLNVGYLGRQSATCQQNTDITSRTADGSPTLSSAPRDSKPIDEPSSKAPVSFLSQPVYLGVALTSASHPAKCRNNSATCRSVANLVSRNSCSESPVKLRVQLYNSYFYHKFANHRRFTVQDWHFAGGPVPCSCAPTTTPPDLLKLAQMDQVHESQLMKLAKAIPSMIQQVIKKAMQPARDKLKGFCTTVVVLENEMITLRKELATLTGPSSTSNPTPFEPAAVPS